MFNLLGLGYRPNFERPVSWTYLLQREWFSCVLKSEGKPALPILDTTNIKLKLARQQTSEPQGILEATISLAASAKILRA